MTDNVNPYAAQPSHTQEKQEAIESAKPEPEKPWFIDEGVPGQGARPSWMPEKFEKLSDIEKARASLESRMGSFTGAPEKYDVAALELDEADPTVVALADVSKELGMSQDGFNKLIGRLTSIQETEKNINLEEQVSKMGKDGERMLTEFKNWTRDYMKPHEVEVVKEWVKTSDDLKVFNRMMAHTHMSQVPTMQSMQIANQFESVQALRAELTKNISKYENDKNYRADYSARLTRAVARET